jgi:hypothetical protein
MSEGQALFAMMSIMVVATLVINAVVYAFIG